MSRASSIVVYDLDAGDTQPHAVFTGDTLFIVDVGRPDSTLRSAGRPPNLAACSSTLFIPNS